MRGKEDEEMLIHHPYRDPVVFRPPDWADRRENLKFSAFMLAVLLFCCAPALVASTGCGFLADEDQAIRAATNLGFTEVRVESRAVLFLAVRGCSGTDDAGFTVTGRNPQGNRVTLLVCVGWPFKGATVRTR